MKLELLERVLAKNKEALLAKGNVVAVGIGYKEVKGKKTDKLAIIVSVAKKMDVSLLSADDLVPQDVEGAETDVKRTGEFKAIFQNPQKKYRPIFGGISVAHKNVTAGTIGHVVYKNGEAYILSNNHVIANSNDAKIGDEILQPGPYDGGKIGDRVATLSQFVPIRFNIDETGGDGTGCNIAGKFVKSVNWVLGVMGRKTKIAVNQSQATSNLVDCALAKIDSNIAYQLSLNGLRLDIASGFANPRLGDIVRKTGRTTGMTEGIVEQINVTVNVDFGSGRIAQFTDQFMAGDMSDGGDSGSLAINEDARAIGLLFAGSATTTIFNRYSNVASALGL